jgi:Tol biopolymer transport system component/DNA-binding winged helix-turn-helix (wHTH) protein
MTSRVGDQQIYDFGVFRLDPDERLLLRNGQPVPLTPKAFDLLVYLVQRQGKLVQKFALMAALWPDTSVEEANLAFQISALRKALGEGANGEALIQTVPTRGYRFVGSVRVVLPGGADATHNGAGAPVARRRRTSLLVLIASIVLLVSVAAAWLLLRPARHAESPPMRLLQLTTLTGQEYDPTFSPDGEQVAFRWDGPKQDNWDIYITLVGSSDVRRLTTDPAEDSHPKWSPDGRQIAFLRGRPDGTTIQLVSALGGADRKLSDFRGADSIGWSPDGHWLAVGRAGEETGQPRGIYLIPVEGGDPSLLIASKPRAANGQPAFSPDGRRLAYVSCDTSDVWLVGRCDIFLLQLNGARTSSVSPLRLTTQRSLWVDSPPAWTRDGSAVVYTAAEEAAPAQRSLWRVSADGSRAPERIEIAGSAAFAPATAPSRDRLAFSHVTTDSDIYRFEVGRLVQLVVGSTLHDVEPRLSPDGRRLVFSSMRGGGTYDLWLAGADGSNLQQLTHGFPGVQGSPSWSPDGRQIVFDSFARDDPHPHIWIIDADGGMPRRLTTQAGDERLATWSHDGRWIYFTSEQGAAARDVWRVSADGRMSERLIHGGSGRFACESFDGKTLLFKPKMGDSPLMAMPLTGGAAHQLVPCIRGAAFGVGPLGVYYVPCDPSPNPSVHVLDLKTSRDRRLGTLDGIETGGGLSVSPDGRTIVYQKLTIQNADLMLIDNFR